ncbi:MAG: major facilitator superfamily 1 [Ramlibacter sp.]|nr:major facilitator superfamily 1 [Ramlibacter sp.]
MDHPVSSIPARLLLAKALRGFADGFVSLLLPLHLLQLGLSPLEVGVIATTTLLGSGLLTLWVGAQAGRWPLRTLLLAATLLMAGTGAALVLVQGFWPLLLVALVGTINPSGGDVSVFLPLEHAMLAHSVEPRRRTATFARYSLVGTLAGAFGALAAALPSVAAARYGVALPSAMQGMFGLYALLAVAAALVYRGLPRQERADAQATPSALGPSRRRVYLLAALFSLDAFGGGFVVQSLVALWLFQRFGVAVDTVAAIFFWTGLLTAFSYLVAVRIAERIGLVRTMVYTHLPSSLCLLAIPFCGSLHWAVALLLVRSALSQMDVPTRSSYVMAVVTPAERPAAASLTAVPRSLAAAASPALAGWLLGVSAFGWPLVAGAVLKIVYDLLLLALFSGVEPPEESQAPGRPNAAR